MVYGLNCSSANDILRIIGASYGRFTSISCHPNSWPTPSSQWNLQCSAGGSFALHQKEQTDPLKHNPQMPSTLSYPATLIYKITSSTVTDLTTPMKTELSSPMFPGSSEIVSIDETCDEDKLNITVSVEVFAATLIAKVLIVIFIIVILVIYFRSKLGLLESCVAQNYINTMEQTRYLDLNRENSTEHGYSSIRVPDYLELY
ncbi:Hypothetical predicted protein [Mytilus galloprovincialis]|uniref:Uncharacterized protein n=1 Tax=Mytilus galloprovincialis TaxID=29158 RepID=A0A8B6EHD0_MYTGA|nr:Hypothetical predicted protein [Mytilus galloprovincialis]